MARLRESEIQDRLRALTGWERDGERLRKRYRFDSFPSAIAFVNRVAAQAESADHHPDILVEYTQVTLILTSHDTGGLTERDFRLAAAVDAGSRP